MNENQMTKAEIKYYQKKYLWDIYSNTKRAINNKIEYAIKQIYLDPIFDKLGGLTNNSFLDVILFLYVSCKDIDNVNMENYVLTMNLYDA